MARRVTIRGDRELERLLLRLAADVRPICTEALDEWGTDVETDAQIAVPVDTGRLQDAIEHRVDDAALVAEVGVWDDDAYYAPWVEDGNSRQDAQPFLRPAFERNRDLTPYVRPALERRLR